MACLVDRCPCVISFLFCWVISVPACLLQEIWAVFFPLLFCVINVCVSQIVCVCVCVSSVCVIQHFMLPVFCVIDVCIVHFLVLAVFVFTVLHWSIQSYTDVLHVYREHSTVSTTQYNDLIAKY